MNQLDKDDLSIRFDHENSRLLIEEHKEDNLTYGKGLDVFLVEIEGLRFKATIVDLMQVA